MPMSSVSAQNEIESRDEERERGQWEQGTKKTLTDYYVSGTMCCMIFHSLW